MTETPHSPPPGWYANPEGPGQRYWDGANWTDQFSEPDAGTPKTRWGTSPAYWVACGALVGMVVGGVGPWITLGPLTFSGTSGGRDGSVVVGAAVLGGVFLGLFAAMGRRGWLIGAGIIGLLMLVTTIVDVSDINDVNALGASAGWGIWLSLVASGVLMIASIASRQTAPPR